jgi:hypothetical protein
MSEFAQKRRANFLRLVQPTETPTSIERESVARFGWQSTLFAADHPSLLVIAELESLDSLSFVTLLKTARPTSIFDIRRVPRFDLGHLNRRLAFELFRESKVEYLDLSGKLGTNGAADPSTVSDQIKQVAEQRRRFAGPIVILVDRPQLDEQYILSLVDFLPEPPDHVWDILKLPLSDSATASDAARTLLFISHANPEDNDFAAWLTGKLAIAGYSVWSDVTKLIGGDVIWNNIDDAIREHAAKIIVILSRVSQTKEGVLDEIDLSIRVERSRNLPGFVIPIRIDDLPFSEVRANLARKNIIDFSNNWAVGLSALLKVLHQRRVPRTSYAGAAALSRSLDGGLRVRATAIRKAETLISNWLPITETPERIDLMEIDASLTELQSIIENIPWPTFAYLRLIGMIGDDQRGESFSVNSRTVRRRYSLHMKDFLSGTPPELPGMKSQEANNYLASLLRQAWNVRMRDLALVPFEMASGALAWFPPHNFADGNKVTFLDESGKRRRKQLVGWSERRQIFWHAAFEAKAVSGARKRFILRPHVIFTENGKEPLYSKRRMHLLRRSFCRSWWNDRWRDLLLGFVELISKGSEIRLRTGPSTHFKVGPPLRFTSQFAPQLEEAVADDDDTELLDALDTSDFDVEETFEEDIEVEEGEGVRDEHRS